MATVPIPTIARRNVARPATNAPFVRPQQQSGLGDLAQGLGSVDQGMQRQEAFAQQRTEAAKAAERDMDRARASEKVAQWQLDWTQREIDGREGYDPASGKSYSESVMKELDADIDKTVRGASTEFEKRMLRERLTMLRTSVGSAAYKFEAEQRADYKLKSLTATLDARVSTATIDPSQAVELTAQHLAEINSTEFMSPQSKRDAMKTSREVLAYAALRAMAVRDPDAVLQRLGVRGKATGKSGQPGASDVQQGLQALRDDPLVGGLSAPRLNTLIDEATQLREVRRQKALQMQEVAQRRAEAQTEKNLREAESAVKATQTLIDSGALPDPVFLAGVQRKAAAGGPAWSQALSALVQQGAERAGFAALRPQEQREQLLAMRARANAEGSNPAFEQRMRQAEEIHDKQTKLIDTDPMQWALNTRLIDRVPQLDFTDMPSLTRQLRPHVELASTVSAHLGRPVSPLLTEQAQRVGRLLSEQPGKFRTAAVRDLAAAMPTEQARALAAQIGSKHGLGQALFLAMQPQPAGGVDLVALTLQGADAIEARRVKGPGDDAVVAADRLRIARELDRVPWPTPKARDAAVEAAGLLYAGLQDQKGSTPSWRTAVEYATGGLAEHNGKPIPVPPGWDARRFRTAMRNVDAVTIAGQTRGPLLVNGAEVRVEDLVKTWGAIDLVPMGSGQYVLDTGGAIVTTAQRRPFVFTLRD